MAKVIKVILGYRRGKLYVTAVKNKREEGGKGLKKNDNTNRTEVGI